MAVANYRRRTEASGSLNRIDHFRQHVETQRRRLLGADAVIVCARYALDSQTGGLDELRVMDALQLASEIINDAVAALEVARGSAS